MKIVRCSIFETNSSSTHTLTICTKEEYDAWVRGEKVLNRSTNQIVDKPSYDDIYLRSLYFNSHASHLSNGFVYDNVYYETLEDLINSDIEVAQEDLDAYKRDYSLYSYHDYMDTASGMEYSVVDYVSPSGDELVGFGYGGYDG